MRKLASGEQALFVADARVMADDPDKLQRAVGADNVQLAQELAELLTAAERELIFISPYYVPGNDGVEFAANIAEKGVRVVVVTNSLASTNHIPVHSAYSGYRRRIVREGIDLYEVRADAGREAQGAESPERLTLHTKLIVIDRRYLFVGSLNLDPRSIEINAEMGLLIDSPELAELVAEGIAKDLPKLAYKVSIGDRRFLEWRTNVDGREIVENNEPLSSRWRRFKAWFLRIVPEGQL